MGVGTATLSERERARLVRCGFLLEYATLSWNVVGIVILALAALTARSVALAGFGLDSLIEIGASILVVWELFGTGEQRQKMALQLIGAAFAGLGLYLAVQRSSQGVRVGGLSGSARKTPAKRSKPEAVETRPQASGSEARPSSDCPGRRCRTGLAARVPQQDPTILLVRSDGP